MSVRSFGEIGGTPVFEVTIASTAGASAKILTWGAVVRDLVVPASNGLQRVVLGLNTPGYILQSFTMAKPWDLYSGLVKSVVFAWLVITIACHMGLRVEGGAGREPVDARDICVHLRVHQHQGDGVLEIRPASVHQVDAELWVAVERLLDIGGEAVELDRAHS